MKKPYSLYILLSIPIAVLTIACSEPQTYNVNTVMPLNEGWSFKMKNDSLWLPATIPGTVHTDLLENGKIPQPFYRDNEKSLQWIDKEDWIYRCKFSVDSALLTRRQAMLFFKGLDTYASITLNGEEILETDNMFRQWKAEISSILHKEDNILEITFHSPIQQGLKKLEESGYGLPAVNDQSENGGLGNKKVSVFTRKAPYHYGWDWGPRFVTSGIWRPVEIVFTDLAQIENVYYKQNNILVEEAIIDAEVNIDAVVPGNYTIQIISPDHSDVYAEQKMYLEAGANSVTLPFHIPAPRLWWPNGMGEQYRYSFKTILSEHETIIDTLATRIGLRSIRLVREPDSTGTSFFFRVNGKPVFAKGANYIPNDNFLPRVSDEKYKYIVESAAKANMNMLRVWGGGIYENDIFYELCDKQGIMVWQDFMFACSMYPGDDEFLDNVYQEAIDNLIRLRNHASIVLWCGNNEIDGAWCEGDMNCGWGWKQRYTPEQRKTIWCSYDTLFHKILPDIVRTYDGIRDYWPSSPQADWGKHASYNSTSGDMHYWGVWHGKQPFSEYYHVVGRFMSEYGFQSFPDYQSVKQFTMPHDWDVESDVMMAHQRSGMGNRRIVEYMRELYPVPEEFTDLLYMGQVLQAEGIKQAIHAHRAHKSYCMGTLYWQLNDCWPAASWSSIDYYGSWKALHYYVKKAYEPVITAFIPDDNNVIISICSDDPVSRKVQLYYAIKDFKGNTLDEQVLPSSLNPEKAIIAARLKKEEIFSNYNTKEIYLEAKVLDNGQVITKDIYFFEAAKDLHLPVPVIRTEINKKKDQYKITLSTDKLARNVYLYFEGCETQFSDNYFDLLPGETKIITCKAVEKDEQPSVELQIKVLNNLVDFNN